MRRKIGPESGRKLEPIKFKPTLKPPKVSPNHRGHDPRQLDLLAVIALLVLVAGAFWYLTTSFTPPTSKTAFIVPSQSVRW